MSLTLYLFTAFFINASIWVSYLCSVMFLLAYGRNYGTFFFFWLMLGIPVTQIICGFATRALKKRWFK